MGNPANIRMLKGAIIAIDPANPLASIIVFQYNPNTLTRELQPRSPEGGARAEAMRLGGAPIETISLEADIDATDQVSRLSSAAQLYGIYPQLSALEMLITPKTRTVIANSGLAALGTIELIGAQTPLTLFVWGVARVLPVRIESLRITEQMHDPHLNPIRASVDMTLRVLSYSDLSQSDPGYHLYLTNQILKETMATLGSLSGLSNAVGPDSALI